MGELISLDEYKQKLLQKEIDELKQRLQQIVKENDLYVENLPYYDYNSYGLNSCFIPMSIFTAFDFYY